MLPKRKIIRKRHQRPVPSPGTLETAPLSLLDRLRSPDIAHSEEALALLSSLCVLGEGPNEMGLLAELIALTRRAPRPLLPQCLYALGNLCEVSDWAVGRLLELGLPLVLGQLDPTDGSLLKPVMLLMLAMHPWLPESHSYLERGVQSWVKPEQLQGAERELVLEFLVVLGSGAPECLWPELVGLMEREDNYYLRSMAGQVILQFPSRNQVIPQLLELWEELFSDIDLEKEYQTNIVAAKPLPKEATEAEAMEDEEASPVLHPNYATLANALQAVETATEALLDLLEEQWHSEEQQHAEHIEEEGPDLSDPLVQATSHFARQHCKAVARNTALSFEEAHNLAALSLRLLSHCGLEPVALGEIVCGTLRRAVQSPPAEDVMNELLTLGTHLLLKCGPVLAAEKELLLGLGESVLRVTDDHREAWLRLLEVYSVVFNPERAAVSGEDNLRVGAILKGLIVSIPHLQLEEWRAQTLDTLFDVYCNEAFDAAFTQLGLPLLLQQVHEAGRHSPPRQRFLREVMADLTRFLAYKRKMIGW